MDIVWKLLGPNDGAEIRHSLAHDNSYSCFLSQTVEISVFDDHSLNLKRRHR